MAYLPPQLALRRPESIGMPIPGGSMRIEPVSESDGGVGELVYSGANVMLGYAAGPEDLERGRTITELRTGDLGRRESDGLYQVVGRRSRFLKVAGTRVDPEGVEHLLERHGVRACAVGTDDQLVVFAEPCNRTDLREIIRDAIGLPMHALRVIGLPDLPRLSNGKPDRGSMQLLAASEEQPVDRAPARDATVALRPLYASALGTAQPSQAARSRPPRRASR